MGIEFCALQQTRASMGKTCWVELGNRRSIHLSYGSASNALGYFKPLSGSSAICADARTVVGMRQAGSGDGVAHPAQTGATICAAASFGAGMESRGKLGRQVNTQNLLATAPTPRCRKCLGFKLTWRGTDD